MILRLFLIVNPDLLATLCRVKESHGENFKSKDLE